MSSWMRLAWKEFWLPFRYRKAGCPGGRDFVWLTIFMALILTLILLLVASREGLLNRFVDVLLGTVPGYGIPVSVTNNMLSKEGINGIDTIVLTEVQALSKRIPGLQIYPYRTLEANLYPLISLPDERIWKNRREDGSKFGPDFDGWAVYSDDPLWNQTSSQKAFPSEIILNRSLFGLYFDYEKYRTVLQTSLPETLLATMPETFGKEKNMPFKELWLQVVVNDRRELLPFKVKWVERFAVIEKIAYLFPLSTYHALMAAHDFPELRYFPEGNGNRVPRIKQILIEGDQEQASDSTNALYEQFASVFGAKTVNYRGDLLVAFEYPVPQSLIDTYAKQYNIQYQIMETIIGDEIKHGNGTLRLPCGRLPTEYLRDVQFTSCTGDMLQPVELDVTAKGRGFLHALVYVPDRTVLSITVDELRKVKEQALSIHPSYQDALNRFSFLSTILKVLEKPYSWFLVIFLIAILGVQIGTLIGHRRQRYGVFLAKGMEWWQVYSMLWLQILMAMASGMIAAFSIITGARMYLQSVIESVAAYYADTLTIADLNLLPFTYMEFWTVSGGVLVLAWSLATLFLYRMPLKRRTHPAILLQ